MAFSFCSFASGSSGNCYLVKTEQTAILIDAGISGKRVLEGLADTETAKEAISALLITHEHSDHIRGISIVSKKLPQMLVYANNGTWSGIHAPIPEERRRCFKTGDSFMAGDIQIRTFAICHDAAEPASYSLLAEGKQITVLTDTGCVTEEMVAEIESADLLVLEANHDVQMLQYGRYPWFLKQRILSKSGHLSNIDAGDIICRLCGDRKRIVLLAHLSKENNFPEMAIQTVKNQVEEKGGYITDSLCIRVLSRESRSEVFAL